MAGSDVTIREHAWVRGNRPLEYTFAGVIVVTSGVVAVTNETGVVGSLIAIALLLCQVPVYLWSGRTVVTTQTPPREKFRYLLLVGLLFLPATFAAPTAAFALFALAPLTYMSVHPVLASIVVTVLNAGPITWVLSGEASKQSRIVALAVIAGTLALSLVLGMWIYGVIRQSRDRGELIRRLEQTRAELAVVSKHAGVLEERRRMAREIHDTLAQGFSSISMLLQAAEAEPAKDRHYLRLARQAAQVNLDESRALVSGSLDVVAIPESIRRVAERFAAETGVATTLDIADVQRRLEPRVEIVLLRVTQEALANARKHSGAAAAAVTLEFTEDSVRLLVRDNGSGFDAEAEHRGHGLRGIRERVAKIGGSVDIVSSPVTGTAVTVEVPV